LKLDDLRFWSVSGFPDLVFCVERQQHIDVGRVLRGERDLPAWLGERQ
jgi:toxin ParE1/3/4